MVNKRAVLYVSEKCNQKCKFCVFRFSLNKYPNPTTADLKKSLLNLKNKWGMEYIDLAGAEPTLNPDLYEILAYCHEIGLKPTIITNGQLAPVIEKCLPLLDGVVLSLHNIGLSYEDAVQTQGSWKRMEDTLKMLKKNNFPFRVNCHVYNGNVNFLDQIIDLAVEYGASNFDLLGFCGDEFTNKTAISYSQSAEAIKKAIDYAQEYPLKLKVRWIPLCLMKGYEKYVVDWHQWIYDELSWNEAAGNNVELKTEEDYKNWIEKKLFLNDKFDKCLTCKNRNICDGINPKYTDVFGTDEFQPVEGELILNPMFYREND